MNFMKFTWFYFALSLLVIIPGLASLVRFGLKPAIDFTGGSLVELRLTPTDGQAITESSIIQVFAPVTQVSSIQISATTVLVRTGQLSQEQLEQVKQTLATTIGQTQELRFETVGPTLGKELLRKTVSAIVLASSLILAYITYRFKSFKFGVCATLATLHDTAVVLGSFSLLGWWKNVEVDTLFVTAVLTILSFSVHDTIVVYDRIRETKKLYPKWDFTSVVNHAISTTLSRSINNSLTIIFMLLALFLLGGVTIHWFVGALLIGTISGTYSSTFTAAPLLVVWEKLANSRIRASK